MNPHARRRALVTQWPTVLWLAVVWTFLWGEITWANVLGGLAVGVIVTLVFPLPSMRLPIRVRPFHLLRLSGLFLGSLGVASFQVAWQALSPRTQVHGAVVGVRLRNPADLYLTVTAELSTLVPGTLVVEAQRITGMLYLHVLDLATSGGEEKVRQDVLDLEEHVLYALASDEELARAGLAVAGRWSVRRPANPVPTSPAPTAADPAPEARPHAGEVS